MTGSLEAPKPDSLDRLLRAVTFFLVFILLARTPADADMWWHLRAGQVMWQEHSILLTDVFSFTRAGAAWTNAFWLADLVLYGLYALGGFPALSLFGALMGALTFRVATHRVSGNPFLVSFVAILAAITAAPVWSPRPQLFSFLLLAFVDDWLTERAGRGPRPLWMLAPVFALWANLHGGWIWGFLLLLAHLAARIPLRAPRSWPAWRPFVELLAWGLAATVAVAVNPNGFALWKLPFHTVNVSLAIQEWASPDFHRIDLHPMLWMVLLLIVAARWAATRPDTAAILKVTGFAYLTFVSQRSIAPFAIVAAPVLAQWSDAALKRILAQPPAATRAPTRTVIAQPVRAAVNFVLLAALALAGLGRALHSSSEARVHAEFPSGAVDWIRQNRPPGRLFNSYNWGGYLIWSLPEYPVFIDGRADLYGSEGLGTWWDIVGAGEAALRELDQHGVNTVVLEPDWPIVPRLTASGWTEAYRDSKSVVLIR